MLITDVGEKTVGDYHHSGDDSGLVEFETWIYSEFFSCISFILETIWFDLQPDAFCKF